MSHVFFLTLDEIDVMVSGSAMFPDHLTELVALRRVLRRSWHRLRPLTHSLFPRASISPFPPNRPELERIRLNYISFV